MDALGFFPAFGGQNFHPLRQQDSRFALHHHLVLQIIHRFDHFGQLQFQTGQGLARQRRAGFGGIPLPSQGVRNIDAGTAEQLLRSLCPFGRQCVLTSGAFELVQFFTQVLRSTFVTGRQFFVNVLHVFLGGLSQQPLPQTGTALARGWGGENATGQGVQTGEIEILGRCWGHCVNARKDKQPVFSPLFGHILLLRVG